MNLAKLLVIVSVTVSFSNARAWDAVGHMLVDSIAAERLTPAARQAADGG